MATLENIIDNKVTHALRELDKVYGPATVEASVKRVLGLGAVTPAPQPKPAPAVIVEASVKRVLGAVTPAPQPKPAPAVILDEPEVVRQGKTRPLTYWTDRGQPGEFHSKYGQDIKKSLDKMRRDGTLTKSWEAYYLYVYSAGYRTKTLPEMVTLAKRCCTASGKKPWVPRPETKVRLDAALKAHKEREAALAETSVAKMPNKFRVVGES